MDSWYLCTAALQNGAEECIMEFLIFCLIVVLLVRWLVMRSRIF